MKTIVPDYLPEFHCIAGACRHTCCVGWEIDVDEESLPRLLALPEAAPYLSSEDTPHIRLLDGERCPFLNREGLCSLILKHGEDILCQICRDHPRFRNYWTDRTEMGLGLVCEEAARLILSRDTPLKLIERTDDSGTETMPEDEAWLLALRGRLLDEIVENGPSARLKEYLLFRHLPDALYDGRVDARMRFIDEAHREIMSAWTQTDGSIAALIEIARQFSYDVEYDDEEKERRLARLDTESAEDFAL